MAAADQLDGPARVVSMPSWELFAEQDDSYAMSVLPPDLPSVSVEAGVTMGWERWVDRDRRDRPLRRVGARPRCSSSWGSRPRPAAERELELLA